MRRGHYNRRVARSLGPCPTRGRVFGPGRGAGPVILTGALARILRYFNKLLRGVFVVMDESQRLFSLDQSILSLLSYQPCYNCEGILLLYLHPYPKCPNHVPTAITQPFFELDVGNFHQKV